MMAYESMLNLDKKGIGLLIIDPQVDFHPGGSLAVEHADEDAKRIAQLVAKVPNIKEIYVTLDSHEKYHIAHPLFWINDKGQHPKPFTTISKIDVLSGLWKATHKEHQKWAESYVTGLEAQKRFTLTIWPEHCLIGTTGHAVFPVISEALAGWETRNSKAVHYILKGNNSLTEHYSALKAEIEVKEDPSTSLNKELLNDLKAHDNILICGQALSHCVNFTTRDLVANWDEDRTDQLVLLKDATSSIKGHEHEADKFLRDMYTKGVQLHTVQEIIGGHLTSNITSPIPQPQPRATGTILPNGEAGCYLMLPTSADVPIMEFRSKAPPSFTMFFANPNIPPYKFKKQSSKSLMTSPDRVTERFRYDEILKYLKEAATFKAAVLFADKDAEFSIYGLTMNDVIVPLTSSNQPLKIHNYSAIAVIPKISTAFKGEKVMNRRNFLSTAASVGASTVLTSVNALS